MGGGGAAAVVAAGRVLAAAPVRAGAEGVSLPFRANDTPTIASARTTNAAPPIASIIPLPFCGLGEGRSNVRDIDAPVVGPMAGRGCVPLYGCGVRGPLPNAGFGVFPKAGFGVFQKAGFGVFPKGPPPAAG